MGEGVTTPADYPPLVFPSVAFRPTRLLVVCAVLAAVAIAASAWAGPTMFGVFFGVGLGMGFLNAVLVQRSVASITADAHPLKRTMAVNSAARLLAITTGGLIVAYLFRPLGVGVLFGVAVFQVVLVISTMLPVWKKIRTGADDVSSAGSTSTVVSPSIPSAIPKD